MPSISTDKSTHSPSTDDSTSFLLHHTFLPESKEIDEPFLFRTLLSDTEEDKEFGKFGCELNLLNPAGCVLHGNSRANWDQLLRDVHYNSPPLSDSLCDSSPMDMHINGLFLPEALGIATELSTLAKSDSSAESSLEPTPSPTVVRDFSSSPQSNPSTLSSPRTSPPPLHLPQFVDLLTLSTPGYPTYSVSDFSWPLKTSHAAFQDQPLASSKQTALQWPLRLSLSDIGAQPPILLMRRRASEPAKLFNRVSPPPSPSAYSCDPHPKALPPHGEAGWNPLSSENVHPLQAALSPCAAAMAANAGFPSRRFSVPSLLPWKPSPNAERNLEEDGPSSCPHPKPWKRLRAKLGTTYFACVHCDARLRVDNGLFRHPSREENV